MNQTRQTVPLSEGANRTDRTDHAENSAQALAQAQAKERSQRTRGLLIGLAVIAAVAVLAAFLFDDTAIRWVNSHQYRGLKNLAGRISHYGDWPFLMLYSLAMIGIARLLGKPRWVRLICIMMISASLSGGVACCVRAVSGRTRPNANVPAGWYGPFHEGKWIAGSNKYHAFPSGHTATAVGYFIPLLLVGPGLGGAGLAIALIIGSSRIYLSVHHLSDVTVSILIGAAVAVLVIRRGPRLIPFLSGTVADWTERPKPDETSNP